MSFLFNELHSVYTVTFFSQFFSVYKIENPRNEDTIKNYERTKWLLFLLHSITDVNKVQNTSKIFVKFVLTILVHLIIYIYIYFISYSFEKLLLIQNILYRWILPNILEKPMNFVMSISFNLLYYL